LHINKAHFKQIVHPSHCPLLLFTFAVACFPLASFADPCSVVVATAIAVAIAIAVATTAATKAAVVTNTGIS
jgi:hypothetical protein